MKQYEILINDPIDDGPRSYPVDTLIEAARLTKHLLEVNNPGVMIHLITHKAGPEPETIWSGTEADLLTTIDRFPV